MVQGQNREEKVAMEIVTAELDQLSTMSFLENASYSL
jgi:hypothetical protein